ncbi:MAG: carotenoid 1,2-hydratase [Hyphomicrobiales bacterium]
MVPRGYIWWYVDGLSDDGRNGITLIGFIGSVFSPYYWLARKRGGGDPFNHCSLNVAVYGKDGRRWAFTERGRQHVRRDENAFSIGPSSMTWDGRALTVRFDEVGCPIPRRVRGTVRLVPQALTGRMFHLDEDGLHRWSPLSPFARIEVDLEEPRLSWQGAGYFDSNDGDVPLEETFHGWDWCRGAQREGASILYETRPRTGRPVSLALSIDRTGDVSAFTPASRVTLPKTSLWRIERGTRAEAPGATVLKTLEDTPFYARSELLTRLNGEECRAVHESLDLNRFDTPIVQFMLPFREPRALR